MLAVVGFDHDGTGDSDDKSPSEVVVSHYSVGVTHEGLPMSH